MDATPDEGAILNRLESYLTGQVAPVSEQSEQEELPEVESELPVSTEVEAEQEQKEDVQDEVEETHLELSQFAKILGIDEDKLDLDDEGNVFVKTKVDGEEGRAKFQDLVKSYQLEGHLNKRNMEVAEQQKALQAKMVEVEQQVQARVQNLETMTQLAHQELQREYQSIDWNDLRVNDPGEFAAKVAEYQQREARIGQAVQQIQAEKTQATQQAQVQLREHLKAEDQKLVQAIEGWSDMSKAQKELSEVYSHLRETYGFDNSDLVGVKDNAGNFVKPGIMDHRLVVISRKAMLYDQLMSTKPTVTKKVVSAPKLVKPGTPKSASDRDANGLKAIKTTIRKSGGKDGIEDFLIRSGKV